MKIDRQHQTGLRSLVKRSFTLQSIVFVFLAGLIVPAALAESPQATPAIGSTLSGADSVESNARSPEKVRSLDSATDSSDPMSQHDRAAALIQQVIDRLANGAAFDCKVRQRVRTAGREVLGVGTYKQVGSGTGQFSFQVDLFDGVGNHHLQQSSDGRLTWTRSEISGVVSLSRVDVGWLDEGARALRRLDRIKPSMRVGGPSEMLDTMVRDFDLKLGTSELAGRPLLVVIGTLNARRRNEIAARVPGASWPINFPTRINVAIAQEDDPESQFGKGLPIRIEHLSDPMVSSSAGNDAQSAAAASRQMISLLEFYSIRPMAPPPIQHFRIQTQDTEIDFVNETSRYEERFDIRVSAKDRQRFR